MTRSLKIACIGTRTEEDQDGYLFQIGAYLARLGNIISGNAIGSDYIFASGANSVNPELVTLYLPWASYNRHHIVKGNKVIVDIPNFLTARDLAKKHHPNWGNLSEPAKWLMIRNAAIIQNSDVVVANPGTTSGGTQHGLRIAKDLGLPIVNLASSKDTKLNFLTFLKNL